MDSPIEIFFSYAHEDEDLMNDVRRQLIVFERNGRILKWHDRMIPPGTEWRAQIDSRLQVAQVILLFMSPHFIESRYCYEVEATAALKRHKSGEARVVPVVLRPCAWEHTPFGELQALPSAAKPISRWQDRDEACLDTAKGVMRIVDELNTLRVAKRKGSPSPPRALANLTYCSRCGQTAGKKSYCTGPYTHHDFVLGSSLGFCERCGVQPGKTSYCTGAFTHHAFTNRPARGTVCSRCGERAGHQSHCTGQYTHHAFLGI